MIIFLFLVIFLQFGISYFLFTKIEDLQKVKGKPKQGNIILPKLKEMPKIEDIDPESKLLKDIIEIAKLENWKPNIIEEPEVFCRSWRIEISNPSNTLSIKTLLRMYDDLSVEHSIQIGYFNTAGVSFNCKENKLQKYIITEYLWSLILKENEDKYVEVWNLYIQDKEKIENCLKTLKRDRQLRELFQ